MADAAPPHPWGEHELEEGCDRDVSVGPLRLRLRLTRDEIWLAHETEPGGGASSQGGARLPSAGDAGWTRWAAPEGSRSVRLMPCFPDRPLVARPEHPFFLAPGASVRIYVRVPLTVRVTLPAPREATLAEVPTVTLSDTWFGDTMEGELMYFLQTTARRELRAELFEPHLSVCPLTLVNGSSGGLEVEKIALRVAHLSLFARNGELWADETSIRYQGTEEGSEIRMAGRPPSEARDAELVTPPRVPAARGLRARTFARLKSLPGLGTAF